MASKSIIVFLKSIANIKLKLYEAGLSRPEKSLHFLVNNPATNLHRGHGEFKKEFHRDNFAKNFALCNSSNFVISVLKSAPFCHKLCQQ